MKAKYILALLTAVLIAPAQAQNCGSGGGATVCLNAAGSADSIKLTWTVSGAITGLQI
jgi:endoglucanase